MRRPWRLTAALVATAVAMGCTDAPRHEAASPAAPSRGGVWWSGDGGQAWIEGVEAMGSQQGGEFNSDGGYAASSTDVAHTGRMSIKAVLPRGSGGTRLFRWAESRNMQAAYYSVYLYLPRQYRLTGKRHGRFWNLMQFKSTSTAGRSDPLWVLNADNGPGGRLYLAPGWGWGGATLAGPRADDHVGGKTYATFSQPLPVGRWVHIEAYLRESSGFAGRISFWQDGHLMFTMDHVRTAYRNCAFNPWCADNQWSVDLYTDGMTPAPVVVYFDDGEISTRFVP